jgi:hypothetical protein
MKTKDDGKVRYLYRKQSQAMHRKISKKFGSKEVK